MDKLDTDYKISRFLLEVYGVTATEDDIEYFKSTKGSYHEIKKRFGKIKING